MDDFVRALLDESAAMGISPLARPAATPRGEALRLSSPPPSIQEGGFRNYPTPREPAFGNCDAAKPPCSTHYIGVPGESGALPYLRGVRGTARRMLIAIHGSDLPSWRRHPAVAMYRAAAKVADEIWDDDYAIIAPVFQRVRFKPYSLLEPWTWYWTRAWGYGNAPARFNPCHFLIEAAGLSCAEAEARVLTADVALRGYTGRPSSFEVLDQLIRHEVALLGSQLEYVCLMGHSHGGQAVQRYAMLDRGIADHVQQITSRPLRYVAMNAGAYAYLTAKRWITLLGQPSNCLPSIPDSLEPAFWTYPICDGYDDWPLGLSGAAAAEARGVPLEAARRYAIARFGLSDASLRIALAHNFASKDIHILQSALDDDIGPGATCRSYQQGCSRRERMQRFRASLLVDVPDELHDAMVVVAGNCREVAAGHAHSTASMHEAPVVQDVIAGRR